MRRETVIADFNGTPYVMNVTACRRALVQCRVAGELHSVAELAVAVGISRSTTSRFFRGHGSLDTALAILDKLHLEFGDVFRPA